MKDADLEYLINVECILSDACNDIDRVNIDENEVKKAIAVLNSVTDKYKHEYFKSIHTGKK